MQIHTDRELSANKPDKVIKDHADRCCKLIDVSVPADRNTSTKVFEKLSKYKDLEIEIARMWGMRTETVPVIVGCYNEAVLIRTQWPTLMTTRSSPCSQILQNLPMVDYRKVKSLKEYLVRARISSL